MSEKLKALREAYASGQGPAQVAKKRREAANKGFNAMKVDVEQAQPKAVGSSFVPGDFQARQVATKTIGPGGKVTQQVGKMEVVKREGPQYAATGDVEILTERFDPVTQQLQRVEAGAGREFKLPENFQDRDLKLSEYLSLVDQIKQSAQTTFQSAQANVETFKTGLKSMQDQMRVASDSYNDRLKDLMDTFQASRADLLANIERVQNETGNFLNLEDASLKKELLDAEKTGADKYEILKKYATGDKIDRAATGEDQRAELNRLMQQARAEGVDEAFLKSIQDHADFDQINLPNAIKTLQKRMGDVQPVSKPLTSQQAEQPVDIEANLQSRTQEVIDTPAEKPTNINLNNALTQLSGLELDPKKIMEMSPTELLVNTLAAELKIINDPSIDKLFADQEAAYKKGKSDAESDFNNTISEINKAIEGEDFVPTSLESLTAKVYADTKEQNLESIQLEKDYRSKMFDLQMAEERKKRGRLDGYLKAKLYAMGAQESSAGLHIMSAQINAADTRLQMMETEQNYAISKLNAESRNIKTSFANQIAELNIKAKTNYDSIQADFDDKITKLTENKILSEREKSKLQFQAIKQYQSDVLKVKMEEKRAQQDALELAYKKTRDAIGDAQKLSGDTGYMYAFDQELGRIVPMVDDNGEMIPTFAREKENRMIMKDEIGMINTYITAASKLKNPNDPQFKAILKRIMPEVDLSGIQINSDKDASNLLSASSTYLNNKYALAQYESLRTGVLANMFETGTTFNSPSGFDVLNCGEFLQTALLNLPSGISTIQDKYQKLVQLVNQDLSIDQIKPGMVFVEDVGNNIGHVGMVNRIEGNQIVITEANYDGQGTINNERRLAFNDPRITGYGAFSFKAGLQKQIESNESEMMARSSRTFDLKDVKKLNFKDDEPDYTQKNLRKAVEFYRTNASKKVAYQNLSGELQALGVRNLNNSLGDLDFLYNSLDSLVRGEEYERYKQRSADPDFYTSDMFKRDYLLDNYRFETDDNSNGFLLKKKEYTKAKDRQQFESLLNKYLGILTEDEIGTVSTDMESSFEAAT